MKHRYLTLLPIVLAVVVAGAYMRAESEAPAAPDVTWMKVTKFELKAGGAVMRFMARMAGASKETTETTYLKGDRKRTDVGESASTIVDLAAQTTTEIDHDAKTARVIPFAYFRNLAATAVDGDEMAEPDAPPPPPEPEEPEYEVTFDIDVQDAGESERMLGTRAERWYITLTGEVKPKEGAERQASGDPDEEQEEDAPPPGKIVLFSDIWLVDELPGADEMNDFDRRMAEAIMGEEAVAALREAVESSMKKGSPTAGMGPAPGYSEALSKLAEELSKLDGVPVRTNSYMVSVPNELEFDRDLALGVTKKKKGGLGGLARGLAQRAMNQPQQESAPTQQTIFMLSDETTRAGTESVDGGIFAIPAGYRVIDVSAEAGN